MPQTKTTPNDRSPQEFIENVVGEELRADCHRLVEMLEGVTGSPAHMWGDSIVGFGLYRYRYASGREGVWMETGFSPREHNLVLFLQSGLRNMEELLEQLGPHGTGRGCLYLTRLSDLNLEVLRQIVELSVRKLRNGNFRY